MHIFCKPGEESGKFFLNCKSSGEYSECVFALQFLRRFIQCKCVSCKMEESTQSVYNCVAKPVGRPVSVSVPFLKASVQDFLFCLQ